MKKIKSCLVVLLCFVIVVALSLPCLNLGNVTETSLVSAESKQKEPEPLTEEEDFRINIEESYRKACEQYEYYEERLKNATSRAEAKQIEEMLSLLQDVFDAYAAYGKLFAFYLQEPSRENVLRAVELMRARRDIFTAYVNMIHEGA